MCRRQYHASNDVSIAKRIVSVNEINRIGPRPYIYWIPLLALFAVEALVFYNQVARNIAPFYPSNFDQLSYYLATYDLIDDFQTRGFRAFVGEFLQPSSATGTTFVLQGALLSLVGGANRTALLSLNLLYLLALQFTFFQTVRARTGDIRFAWLGMALLLALATLFLRLGGVYDYRIDFSALCLYGIWACVVVWSGAFRDGWRSLLVAAIGILLIYSRFFTIIYVGAVYGVLLVASVVAFWFNRPADRDAVAMQRLRNILVSGTIVVIVCLPRLYLSREAIYNYYVVGHVLGEERFIRAHEMGLYTIWDHLWFYPKSILFTHIGSFALWMSAATVLISIVAALLIDRVTPAVVLRRAGRFRYEFMALGLATLIPLAILTINIAKSPVVGGIIVIPIALALVLLCAAIRPRTEITMPLPTWPVRARALPQTSSGGWRIPAASIIVTIAMAIGLQNFIFKNLAAQPPAAAADLEQITLLGKTIATYAQDYGLTQPTMSSDRIVDYQNIGTAKLFSIELLHRNLNIDPRFGHGAYGIFATSREDAMRLFADSDIIVLTDPITDRTVPYPMNTKIREYWDELSSWTAQNRILLFSTRIFGIPYRVFVRPLAKITGMSEGWITSEGVSLEANAAVLARYPFIVLEGQADYTPLGGVPQPHAVLLDPSGRPGADLMATIKRTDDKSYRIVIDTHSPAMPPNCPVKIQLTFDRSFVPSKLGINADTRELVLRAPKKRELDAASPE
jgi:hypothetical protein